MTDTTKVSGWSTGCGLKPRKPSDYVPKEPAANVRFRQQMVLAASKDQALQAELWIACRRDILFFFNVFLWTYNPKLSGNKWLPFVSYDFQDDVILLLADVISRDEDDQEDVLIEKSRDMGATVMVLGVFLWFLLFHDDFTFLMGSNKQEGVDKRGNHRALFMKLDTMIERLPLWLRYPMDVGDDRFRTRNHLFCPATRSTIDGEATVKNFGRSDRRSALLMDEFAEWEEGFNALAATADVTNCRIFNSTHLGSHTAFYEKSVQVRLKKRLHWTQHPLKARGLYKDEHGKPRSPWYDKQATRRTSREMKQEIDIDVQGAAGQFFDADKLQDLMREGRLPVHVGEVDFRADELRMTGFRERDSGRFKLWLRLGLPDFTLPDQHRYVVSGDISLGSGASNSVLAVWDRMTLERVAEFVDNRTNPPDLADLAIVLCKWFKGPDDGAFLIWEANGPGTPFCDRILSQGYRNIFYRKKNLDSIAGKYSDKPGIYVTPGSKMSMFQEYERALYMRECFNPCVDALRECLEIIDTPSGPAHSQELKRANNPGSEGKFHADRVIADAIAWHILKEYARVRPDDEQPEEVDQRPGYNTFAGRRREFDRELEAANAYSW